jgi:hypothetical protein
MKVVAQASMNTFASAVKHSELLGYDVIGAARMLLDGASREAATAASSNVKKTRDELCEAIKVALQQEFQDFGIEIVSIAIDDFAPSATDQAHLEEVVRRVQEQQLAVITTNTEVLRALAIAKAITDFEKDNPGADLAKVYGLMRRFDVWALAAEKGNLSLAVQGIAQKFMSQADAADPSVAA